MIVSMNKSTPLGSVSFSGYSPCPVLWAKMTWQFLFDYYRTRGGDVGKMHSMLDDFESLCVFFEDYPEEENPSKFSWTLFMYSLTDFHPNSDVCGDDWWLVGEWSVKKNGVEFTLWERGDEW